MELLGLFHVRRLPVGGGCFGQSAEVGIDLVPQHRLRFDRPVVITGQICEVAAEGVDRQMFF